MILTILAEEVIIVEAVITINLLVVQCMEDATLATEITIINITHITMSTIITTINMQTLKLAQLSILQSLVPITPHFNWGNKHLDAGHLLIYKMDNPVREHGTLQ